MIKGVTLKSGLICYLANTGVRFPSNINTTGANWNMQVVSNGQYSTMSDCAVGDGEELYIGNDIFVYVTNMSADKLEFEISGIAETTPTPTLTPSPTPSPTPTPTINPTPTAEDIAKECMEKIFLPTINAMNAEGRTFEGCLYFGLMLTPNGPKVIEYNCRFGDPETQVVLPMLEGDLCEIFEAIYEHRLADVKIGWKSGYCTCVVMASGGYPVKYKKGIEMFGMDDKGQVDGAFIYHAGTKYEDGKFYTNGGRVLGVTCNAYTLQGALDKSYEAVSKIKFEGEHFRKDIGQKALKALPKDSLDLEYKKDMEDYIEENGVYLRQ